jgi:8-oxo-dGTP pyrophosphatase MutT (NUDIX family)
MKQKTIEEISAGGVVYRKTSGGYEFLLGKHSGYHKWVLPKGLVEKGESQMEAAVREVEEEVGVKAKIVEMSPLKIIEYYYFADMGEIVNKNPHTEDTARRVKTYQEDGGAKTRVHKQVVFYLMEMENDLGSAGWEMEDRQWMSYEDGLKTLAFDSEREVFSEAGKALGI